ncbi:MBL fold metallo-hydrolase [Streptomyces tremellae]|uniref:MBL fold metallo-hydrolase n=1 Tax=Streptomyces tremellae TaxID=1124239 RepID=A0ABP7F6W9_9ACTN
MAQVPPRDAAADVRELAPGLWLLRTPLPGHSTGSLNSYLITGGGRAAVVDTPWGTPDVIGAFADRIAATGTSPSAVGHVLVTHHHEDHSGAAGWLQEHSGSEVVMSARDHAVLRRRTGPDQGGYGAELGDWLDAVGADTGTRAYAFDQQRALGARLYALPRVRCAGDGDTVRVGDWCLDVVETPGHTPGHLCFVERRRGLVFAGDHVFRRRRGNAVARPPSVPRPVASYWQSMAKLLATGAGTVLPGHGEPFTDLAARAGELAGFRERKRAEVVGLAAEPATAWQVARRMRRRQRWEDLNGNARLAATGEALAYLLDARDAGLVTGTTSTPRLWTSTPTAVGPRDDRKEHRT